ncbi:MAG: 1-acyl-sn-glycerol-3-phosphate acyltransferase, partial [Anaeroplasmataceae bacterium]|nr:1-acyl-sn-glycerol-3-phosphate acyltransferase [Anaeroplasmataceae bacterium]
MNLSETTKDVLKRIEKAEREGRFNDHLDDSPCLGYYEIDEDFSYSVSLSKKILYTCLRAFPIKPYTFIANHFWLKTKVVGKSNLKGIKSGAIVTSNHVNKLDSVAIGYALRKHKLHFTAAEFNNMKCRLGTYMRAYGIFPIPSKQSMMKKFQQQLEHYLKQNELVTFFPESSEWWCYEKPRPYQMGAFHYAAKYMVPILPIFITFKKTGKLNKEGIEKRIFIVHILKPIYPKSNLSLKENKEELKKKNEVAVWSCYH